MLRLLSCDTVGSPWTWVLFVFLELSLCKMQTIDRRSSVWSLNFWMLWCLVGMKRFLNRKEILRICFPVGHFQFFLWGVLSLYFLLSLSDKLLFFMKSLVYLRKFAVLWIHKGGHWDWVQRRIGNDSSSDLFFRFTSWIRKFIP